MDRNSKTLNIGDYFKDSRGFLYTLVRIDSGGYHLQKLGTSGDGICETAVGETLFGVEYIKIEKEKINLRASEEEYFEWGRKLKELMNELNTGYLIILREHQFRDIFELVGFIRRIGAAHSIEQIERIFLKEINNAFKRCNKKGFYYRGPRYKSLNDECIIPNSEILGFSVRMNNYNKKELILEFALKAQDMKLKDIIEENLLYFETEEEAKLYLEVKKNC